jgi:MiaB-like tRNA modifying enzyme
MAKERVYFKTFGCKTNWFDTQIMMNSLKNFEVSDTEEESTTVVVNSCTVTNGADATVRGYINSIKRKYPDVKIVLTGCGVHSKGKELFEDKHLFGVMGHSEKENIDKLLQESRPFYRVGDLNHIDKTVVSNYIGRARAFIKIQEGCDFECSYCIIPSVRGLARSYRLEQIKRQVSILASNGFGEFVLTGTNVGSYGKDINISLAKLLKELSKLRGVKRVRVGSLEPSQIDDEFIELLSEPWMAKHLHIAIQHTSNKMLEIMNRRNRFKEDLRLFERLSSLGYALGSDFIVGHPGESDEIWRESVERFKRFPITHIHTFTYSKRDGTPSALTNHKSPTGDISKIRQREIGEIVREKSLKFREKNNKNLNVLVESVNRDGLFSGFDQYYNRVLIESRENISNDWIVIEEVRVDDKCNYAVYT